MTVISQTPSSSLKKTPIISHFPHTFAVKYWKAHKFHCPKRLTYLRLPSIAVFKPWTKDHLSDTELMWFSNLCDLQQQAVHTTPHYVRFYTAAVRNNGRPAQSGLDNQAYRYSTVSENSFYFLCYTKDQVKQPHTPPPPPPSSFSSWFHLSPVSVSLTVSRHVSPPRGEPCCMWARACEPVETVDTWH